jgi:hypothetical protein
MAEFAIFCSINLKAALKSTPNREVSVNNVKSPPSWGALSLFAAIFR